MEKTHWLIGASISSFLLALFLVEVRTAFNKKQIFDQTKVGSFNGKAIAKADIMNFLRISNWNPKESKDYFDRYINQILLESTSAELGMDSKEYWAKLIKMLPQDPTEEELAYYSESDLANLENLREKKLRQFLKKELRSKNKIIFCEECSSKDNF